ncbi:MAG TPA: HigA family addiction module antitoxin [Vicinamibacteria bacterium]|nr:HigA family addiction module antitoxin [Vicinamibacteria bacterium]
MRSNPGLRLRPLHGDGPGREQGLSAALERRGKARGWEARRASFHRTEDVQQVFPVGLAGAHELEVGPGEIGIVVGQPGATIRLLREERMRRKGRRLPPVHPGEILREDLLKPLGISINRLARDLRVPVTRISEIANGRRGITADTALRLARYFGTTPESWMNLQAAYDLDSAQRVLAERIARDVSPREAA